MVWFKYMKKEISRILSIAFLLFFVIPQIVFSSNCTTFGSYTTCSDGTNYSTFGDYTTGSDGSSYSTLGNTTRANDGSSCTSLGSYTTCSNGTNYSNFGNYTTGSDGSSYSTFGNTTTGTGGNMIKTCPSNSSYDSLSGDCKCLSGYKSNGSSCVYNYATTPQCPANSYYDGVSSCKCNYGYVVNGSSCVYKNIEYSAPPVALPTTSYTSPRNTCPINSHISPVDSNKCLCDTGYQINATNDACVVASIVFNQSCKERYGASSYWDGTYSDDLKFVKCECGTGSEWNTGKTACIALEKSFTVPTSPSSVSEPIINKKQIIPATQNTKTESSLGTVSEKEIAKDSQMPNKIQYKNFIQKAWERLLSWF